MNSLNYKKLNERIEKSLESGDDSLWSNVNIKQEVADKLLPYQFLHVFNLMTASNDNDVIADGSDTGTGKTYTSNALCKQKNMKLFVICPKTLMSNWLTVSKYYDVPVLGIVNYDLIRNGRMYKYLGDYNNIIECKYVNVIKNADGDIIGYNWNFPNNTLVIFDEVHRCKNPGTYNGKLLMSTKNVKNIKVLMLSATFCDTPETFRIFAYMLGFGKNIRQAASWVRAMIREDQARINNNTCLSHIYKEIYPKKGSRIQIAELGEKFPDNKIVAACYNLDEDDLEKVNKYFDEITRQKLEMAKNDAAVMSDIMKSRMQIELLKVPVFEELIQDHLENGYAVVVFVNFTETLRILAKKCKTKCILHGKQDMETRTSNIQKFQNNEERLIICNLKVGKEGINLHDLHGIPRVSLISPSFSAIDFQQVLGRIYREGSKTPALQKIVLCAGTCEEYICENIKNKLDFVSQLTDNDFIHIQNTL